MALWRLLSEGRKEEEERETATTTTEERMSVSGRVKLEFEEKERLSFRPRRMKCRVSEMSAISALSPSTTFFFRFRR